MTAFWEDLEDEITEEMIAYAEPPTLQEIASKAVPSEINYRVWSAKEVARLPEKLRARLEKLTRREGRKAWERQKQTEVAAERRANPSPRKKPKPKVPPAPTRYQLNYMKRKAVREKLPETREGIAHHFTITARRGEDVYQTDGYLHVGLYADGRVGEIFVKMGRQGDFHAVVDQWAMAFSIALQYGASLEDLCRKHIGARFEPSGPTSNKEIPRCLSIVDYACRYLVLKYGKGDAVAAVAAPDMVQS